MNINDRRQQSNKKQLLFYTIKFKCFSSDYQIIIIKNESKLERRAQEKKRRGQARIITL
jgi:hypothetical protein